MTYPAGLYVAKSGTWWRGSYAGPPTGPLAGTNLDWPYGAAGTYQPDADHAGIPSGVDTDSFDVYSGPTTITTADQTFTRVKFTDLIIANAANLTFDQCLFLGPATTPSTDKGLLATGASASNVLVQDSTLRPQAPGEHVNGLRGSIGMTVLRCDISHVVDGIDWLNGTWTIKGNYVHDMAYYSPSTTHSDNQTHCDCLAISGGTGGAVIGNNFQAFADLSISANALGLLGPQNQVNSAIMITPDVALMTDLTIDDNWADGGQYSVNVADGTAGTIGDIGEMLRNKFGRLQAHQGSGGDTTYTIVLTDTCTCDTGDGTADQNVYADNGHAVTVRRTN